MPHTTLREKVLLMAEDHPITQVADPTHPELSYLGAQRLFAAGTAAGQFGGSRVDWSADRSVELTTTGIYQIDPL